MAETGDTRLPAAAYVEFATPPAQGAPAEVLERVLRETSGLTRAEMTLPVGAGLLFNFGHPTQTLGFAREMIALARADGWNLPPLRIGLHVAAMSKAAGDNQETTLSGSSIDGAMRVASVAEPNQALATMQFQTLVLHLLKLGAGVLLPLGKRTTASGKAVDVFEVVAAAQRTRAAQAQAQTGAPAPRAAETLSENAIAAIELALAAEIGPIAKVLVKQAVSHLPDQNRFLLELADAVPEPDRRRAFLIKATGLTG